MSSRKLSDSDKRAILDLYRQPGETTLTLASRYGVSSSTISRILRSSLSDEEYESLIQQKRAGRFQGSPEGSEEASEEESLRDARTRRIRKRSSSAAQDADFDEEDTDEDAFEENYEAMEASALREMLGEDLLDEEDLDDEDEDEDEDEEWDEDALLTQRRSRPSPFVEVIPLADAELPKTCYFVVDKGGELITRPLKEFGELGEIPREEVQEKTLPIFDNHRVARRFCARNQRVIKMPDGQMLQKTSAYLQEKGITRVLIDGQVYSL